MLKLRVVPPAGQPFEHLVEDGSVVIGRSADCDLTLPDPYLSRRHTRLYRDDSGWWVEDLGSRNGTWLNGTALVAPARLSTGDELRVSSIALAVRSASDRPTLSEGPAEGLSDNTILRPVSELLEGPAQHALDAAELRRYAERLQVLLDVHQALARPIGQRELLNLVLDRAFDLLRPEEGVVFLRSGADSYYVAASRTAPGVPGDHLYSRTLVEEVVEKGQGALVIDARTDERFAGAGSILSSGIRSLVAAPLLDNEGAMGMVALSSRLGMREFTSQDLELLASLASVAALRLRNLDLVRDAAERQRLSEEVQLARAIQVALLPARLPEIPGWALAAGNVPSLGVSGDFYLLDEVAGELLVLLADVSGKGIGAALLTASLEALAADPIERGASPEEICTLVARRLFQRTPPATYATAFIGLLDPASGSLRYANAGHNPAILMRAGGDSLELGATGFPLGLMPDAEYEAETVELAAGDTLVVYTDGITEAADPDGEEYGMPRLVRTCREHRSAAPVELAGAVESDLEDFLRGAQPADDRTLVLARRL